eukprot:TRINITY_DN30824_c1_g2_i1.p1 TRINITY_DN30824_c1_g2~~TRINITY_DN30824_c1_g2_i1.p1  ORF type:complete len:476 (+),score=106.62 TRINITY_DN30824_c1_g2_i1:200-1429(+)
MRGDGRVRPRPSSQPAGFARNLAAVIAAFTAAACFAEVGAATTSDAYAAAGCACATPQASCIAYFRFDFSEGLSCQKVLNGLSSDPDAVAIDLTGTAEGACLKATGSNTLYKVLGGACQNASASTITVERYNDLGCEAADLDARLHINITEPPSCWHVVVDHPHGEEKEGKWTTRFIVIICLTPFVTAFIGWGTNVVAIKMIFRPYKPVLGCAITVCGRNAKGEPRCMFRGFQGVFPKRQYSLAQQIGDMVNKNLISAEEMVDKMKQEMGLDDANPEGPSGIDGELSEGVSEAVGKMIDNKSQTPGFPMFLRAMGGKEKFGDALTRGTVISFKKHLPFLMETFADSFTRFIPFSEIITYRIRHEMTPADLEDMFMSFMAAELGFVENLGGVLGFIVGVLQTCIFIVAGT